MRKTTKAIENIGAVAINELVLSDSNISLYIPIKKMSATIQAQYEKCRDYFMDSFKKKYPEIDTSSFTIKYDVTLNMYLDSQAFIEREEKSIKYNVSYILWYAETENTPCEETEFSDPFDIDINDEDSLYLKKMVMKKLVDLFF